MPSLSSQPPCDVVCSRFALWSNMPISKSLSAVLEIVVIE